MVKETISVVTPRLWEWAKEDAIYLAEAYRRLSGLDLGVALNLKDVSDALHRLALRNELLKVDVVQRERRVMSPKERYVAPGDKTEVSQRWMPFTLYYHSDLPFGKVDEKRRKLELLSAIGEWSARIAEECLYDVCKDVFGYRDERGRINVVRSAFESPDGDVVVHSAEKVFEVSVRFENSIDEHYVSHKKSWRDNADGGKYVDYDVVIIANAVEPLTWTKYRYPIEERLERVGYCRLHKLGIAGFPLFFDFFWAAPLFGDVYREITKVTRERFKLRLSEIVGRYS